MAVIVALWSALVTIGLVVLGSGPARGVPTRWYASLKSGKRKAFYDVCVTVAVLTLLLGAA